MPTFGELLRRLRGRRSQKEVADDLKMPVTTLSTLENQSSVPRGPVLKRFADYYGMPETYFYPTATSEMTPSESARSWLQSVRQGSADVKDKIAMHAPPDYPDKIANQFAGKIREKKRARTPHHK